jgi:hypothetical protein
VPESFGSPQKMSVIHFHDDNVLAERIIVSIFLLKVFNPTIVPPFK